MEGREQKKIDTKCLLLDYQCFQTFTNETFIQKLQSSIDQFSNKLSENPKGIINKLFLKNNLLNYNFLDSSSNTSLSDIKSFKFAEITTSDPSINIALTLEVPLKNFLLSPSIKYYFYLVL